jgi:aminoglycoside phosphotransferase (APT) family kinase protein
MVPGSAFAARTRGSADCPLAGAAAEWLTSLGAATARPVRPERVAGVLEELLSRYTAIYRPAPEERAFLAQQIARVAASSAAVPGVLQHGDPGTWNVRVRPDGRVVFTDWEAAESCGMPLWDLLYFLRSYVLLGRMRGLQGRLDTVGRHFLGGSPLSALVHTRIARYVERVGVPPGLIEPLFHTCWMHRALKEATRLTPDTLGDGRFVQLLRWGIARRESPGLQRLFGTGVTT